MISADEAFLVLSKLCADKSRIICFGRLIGWESFLLGRINRVSQMELKIVSDDSKSSFLLQLDLEGLNFEYRELKDLPLEVTEGDKDKAGLIIALPLRVPLDALTEPIRSSPRETLTIIEFVEERS